MNINHGPRHDPEPARTMFYVSNKDDVPKQEHWAIFEFSSVHIEGDERSRTHPGHGYGAHDVSTITYRAYLKREEWEAEIQKRERSTSSYERNYVAVKVSKPATTEIKVAVHE